MSNSPLDILSTVFGYSSFRGAQEEIIDTLVAGGDALVLMPTGGGKSLCYQIPALARPGCGVVVSPLIALMQDQVDALCELGVKAAFLNSTQSAEENFKVERALRQGELDLIYVAPERLVLPRTLELLDQVEISLFAIDEAHCVAQWGHDFRRDYLALDCLAARFPHVPRIALTATADDRTRKEILTRLNLEHASQYVASFNRPNIRYALALKTNPRAQLLKFLRTSHPNHAGIVYCLSRKKTEDTASYLVSEGFDALPYHAGLSAEERAANQSRFLREESVIMVATIAFGMGINKPDVRFVAHLDLPKTIESYYQETGRAGRDGEAADAFLLYGLQDVTKLRQMMEAGNGNEEFQRIELIRLNAMLGLCEVTSCRRHALLAYFGEDSPASCGNCDTCLFPVDTWDGTLAAQKALSVIYRTGQRFGVTYLIEVLQGKTNDRLVSFGHDQLPVFGAGTDLDTNQWRSVYRQLIARGYVNVDVDSYGALKLQEKCRPLLRSEETITLRRDTGKKEVARLTKTPIPDDIDAGLFEALRECRRLLAVEQGVPPYIIFHDSTLHAMAGTVPESLKDLARLPGIGERKLNKYGAVFLEAIADYHARSHS